MFGHDEPLHKHGCSYSKDPARLSVSRLCKAFIIGHAENTQANVGWSTSGLAVDTARAKEDKLFAGLAVLLFIFICPERAVSARGKRQTTTVTARGAIASPMGL
jgi:hypothetical protein